MPQLCHWAALFLALSSIYCGGVINTLYRNFADIPIVITGIRTEDGLVADRGEITVLIDEYDAPIVNNLTKPARLEAAKETLHGFYNALKSCENMIDRVFITGITKFSQLSVFSAMNNLMDISFQTVFCDNMRIHS
jgi:hypothetical protein